MKSVLLVLVLVAAAWCSPSDIYKTEFNKFKEQFHRVYANEADQTYHFKVFSDNLDKILKHNQKYESGETSFKLSINQSADMTHEEYLKFLEREHHRFELNSIPEDYKDEFLRFKEKYHKSYQTEEEEKQRFEIFVANLDTIIEHNKLYDQGLSSFREGVNNFTDFTHDEFLEWLEEQGGGHWTTVLPPQAYLFEFEKFKLKYDKSYANKTEESYRLDIFSGNLDEIVKHNEKYERGKESYKKAVTMFTDMTKKEFLKWLEEHGGGRPPWAPTTKPPVILGN